MTTQTETTQAILKAKEIEGLAGIGVCGFMFSAIGWLPALIFSISPVDYVKATWPVGAPVAAVSVLALKAGDKKRQDIAEQITFEKYGK